MYSLKTINEQMDEVIARRNKALNEVRKLDLIPDIKIHLEESVYRFYQPTLASLRQMFVVAEWYVAGQPGEDEEIDLLDM